jgi:hypothetical protein
MIDLRIGGVALATALVSAALGLGCGSEVSPNDTSSSSASGGAGGAAAPGTVGAPCQTGADCASGVCIDVHDVDDGCSPGQYCTVPCAKNDDCPATSSTADCDGVLGQNVCLYMAWAAAHGCS